MEVLFPDEADSDLCIDMLRDIDLTIICNAVPSIQITIIRMVTGQTNIWLRYCNRTGQY